MSEAARLANVSLSTISRAAHRGKLPTAQVGKVLRIRTAEFLAQLGGTA